MVLLPIMMKQAAQDRFIKVDLVHSLSRQNVTIDMWREILLPGLPMLGTPKYLIVGKLRFGQKSDVVEL